MIHEFKNLNQSEIDLLLHAPALYSVFAASGDQEISKREKADAIKLAHLKTFTAHPLLISYYKEIEMNFTNYFEDIVKKYAPFNDYKCQELANEIANLQNIIAKLDKDFAWILQDSLKRYAEHVKKSDRNLFVNFIFPLPIPGFTD